MAEDHQTKLQLLPSSSSSTSFYAWRRSDVVSESSSKSLSQSSSADLQLSISLQPLPAPSLDSVVMAGQTHRYNDPKIEFSFIEALKLQTAEQIRIARMEMAYAEQVRESSRREMEMAQSEFARARHIWARATEELEKAERMKERSVSHMEITCPSCHQRFVRS